MQEQKPLPSLDQAILRVLNRHCHTEGQRHAERLRGLLLEELRRLRAEGASYDDLRHHIEAQASSDDRPRKVA